MNQDVVSFVLRFVREVGEDQQARWRGVIKHVQGDGESHFTQFAEAIEFMQTRLNRVIQATVDETGRLHEANQLMETARLWGEFMPRYTRLMVDTVGEAVESGNAMSQQVERALAATLSAWGMPTQAEHEKNLHRSKAFQEQVQAAVNKAVDSQFEMVMASLKTVEGQVAELSNTLNDLVKTQTKEKSK